MENWEDLERELHCNKKRITSVEFVALFKKYDTDGNGQIDKSELNQFLTDLLAELGHENVKPKVLANVKEKLLEKYDDNFDGMIGMDELEKILPTEENFLMKFRNDTNLTSVDFIRCYNHYDADKSGYLEKNELEAFLCELLRSKDMAVTPQRIADYVEVFMELYDLNKDGKLELAEVAKILPIEENFLTKFEGRAELSRDEFNSVFDHYDKDKSGTIEGVELTALLRDICAREGKAPNTTDMEDMKKSILDLVDINKDGKLSREELGMLLSTT